MNPEIIKAIKYNNIDLFRLLFNYKRLFDELKEDDFIQLIYETIVTEKYLPFRYIPNDKLELKIKKLIMNRINNISSESEPNLKFRYLFNPSEFLDLCTKYTSHDVYNDYIDSLSVYARSYIIPINFPKIHDGYNYDSRIERNVMRLEFLNEVRTVKLMSYPAIWNDPRI